MKSRKKNRYDPSPEFNHADQRACHFVENPEEREKRVQALMEKYQAEMQEMSRTQVAGKLRHSFETEEGILGAIEGGVE